MYIINNFKNKDISLRDEKFASTRITILNNTLLQLKSTTLEKLDIESICRNVNISRRTFFNYFPQKGYIMQYLLSIWVYEISLEFEKIKDRAKGLELIHSFIILFDNKLKEDTNVSKEMIRQLFNMTSDDLNAIPALNDVEKLMLGISLELSIPSPYSLNHIIEYAVKSAISKNQLPKDTSVDDLCILIQSLILGTLQILLMNKFDIKNTNLFQSTMKKQIGIYIKGLNNN